MILEDCKEADKRTGEAAHRISRGIHDKVLVWPFLMSPIPGIRDFIVFLFLVLQYAICDVLDQIEM